MFSDLSPRELKEFRDHLMNIVYGLCREKAMKKHWQWPQVHC